MYARSIICLLAVAFLQLACQGGDTAPPAVADDSTGETAPPANPLAGTGWRLVEFQSMDDATGTIAPDDPRRYTMTLAADGAVAMVLNSNREMGTWSAEPGADGTSGSFRFGPLATTRALCPPPTMDGRIARDAEFVTGYLLRDGRLFLSLMADGGIYAWEPSEDEAFERTPDPALEAAIARRLPPKRMPEGRQVLADGVTFEAGIPLEPRS